MAKITYDQLQTHHKNLLEQYEESGISEELIDEAQDYAKRIREESELVSDPQDREQLRANLSFWASIIYDVTGTYPNTTLRPFNKRKIELAKIQQAIAAQEALRGVLPDSQIEAVLMPLHQKQSELQAKLSGTGAIAQGEGGSAVAATSGSGSVAIGRDIIAGDIVTGLHYTYARQVDETQVAQAKQRYLKTLIRAHSTLPLSALGNEENVGNEVRLENIYIALDTTQVNNKERENLLDRHRGEERSLSALEVATQNRQLVILGDPGSGKSTFVKGYKSQKMVKANS